MLRRSSAPAEPAASSVINRNRGHELPCDGTADVPDNLLTMKKITTTHPELGYTNNVEIVAQALRHYFGFDDNSHVLTAVAAHVWAVICGRGDETKAWGTTEVQNALTAVRARVDALQKALAA